MTFVGFCTSFKQKIMKNKIFCNKPIKEHIKIKEFKNPLSIIIYFSNVVSLTKVTIVL